MSNKSDNGSSARNSKRRALLALTWLTGLSGLTIAAWPFFRSLLPSQRAQLAGGPVRVDLRSLSRGEQLTVVWRGQPIWVLHRDDAMIQRLTEQRLLNRLRDPASSVEAQQPEYAVNETRSINPDYFICTAICTHLGCVPAFRPDVAPKDIGADWLGGYFCPCHKSKFDFAGRVYRGVPAPTNLVVPPHHYLNKDTIEIGAEDRKV